MAARREQQRDRWQHTNDKGGDHYRIRGSVDVIEHLAVDHARGLRCRPRKSSALTLRMSYRASAHLRGAPALTAGSASA